MRTTVSIDDHLLTEAKRIAAETNTSITALIEEALRELLARRRDADKTAPLELTTFRGRGLHPGVNLDDSAALRDIMEK